MAFLTTLAARRAFVCARGMVIPARGRGLAVCFRGMAALVARRGGCGLGGALFDLQSPRLPFRMFSSALSQSPAAATHAASARPAAADENWRDGRYGTCEACGKLPVQFPGLSHQKCSQCGWVPRSDYKVEKRGGSKKDGDASVEDETDFK